MCRAYYRISSIRSAGHTPRYGVGQQVRSHALDFEPRHHHSFKHNLVEPHFRRSHHDRSAQFSRAINCQFFGFNPRLQTGRGFSRFLFIDHSLNGHPTRGNAHFKESARAELYTSGSHGGPRDRGHIVWNPRSIRYKVLEGALRGRIPKSMIRQARKKLDVQIVSGVFVARTCPYVRGNPPSIPPSATSCVRCVKGRLIASGPECGSLPDSRELPLGAAFLGSGRLLFATTSGNITERRHTSESSGARTYRRQPVVIQLFMRAIFICASYKLRERQILFFYAGW